MNNKTFMATIIILAFLISLVAGMQSVETVEANPKTSTPAPTLAPTLTHPPSPSLTTSPTAPEFTPIVVLILAVAVAVGVVALLVRKRQPTERDAVAL